MKKISLFLLTIAILFAACKNNKPKEATIVNDDGKTKVTIDPTTVSTNADEMTKKMEELKKLPPLTTDQLKAMLPDEIMGMKRTSFNANSMMGFASADATYKNEGEEKEIRINIIDCAGEAGAGIYSLNYWTRMNIVSENENGYTKTVDFNGQKAVETYQKSNEEYELTYTATDRLLVSVKGEKTGLDAVKQTAQNLKLKTN